MPMIQRLFAALLIAGISSACSGGGGSGGSTNPSPVADPPSNPNQPPSNPSQPAVNPNQPPSNPDQPPVSGAGGAAPIDDHGGQAGRGGPGPDGPGPGGPGPGNRCTPANGCDCDQVCDACKCVLGDSQICGC